MSEYDEDVKWSQDWEPDRQLVAAVLAAGNRPIATIRSKQDRCWLVAGLKVEGLTAEDMRDRLHCSLRLIRSLLAEDMTTVCRLYMTEAGNFAQELSLVRHELVVRTRELTQERAEAVRVREQRDRMIDMAMTGEPIKVCRRAGHVMDKYNTYIEPGGKRSCRQCRLDAVARHRARNGSNSGITGETSRDGIDTRPVSPHDPLPLPVTAPVAVRGDVRAGVRPALAGRDDAIGEQVGKLQQH